METDAPYLTPVPHRGHPNASHLIPLTVRQMALERGLDETDMAEILISTSEVLYGAW